MSDKGRRRKKRVVSVMDVQMEITCTRMYSCLSHISEILFDRRVNNFCYSVATHEHSASD
jgi:hypothetical protein